MLFRLPVAECLTDAAAMPEVIPAGDTDERCANVDQALD